jgi:hypothetical protein
MTTASAKNFTAFTAVCLLVLVLMLVSVVLVTGCSKGAASTTTASTEMSVTTTTAPGDTSSTTATTEAETTTTTTAFPPTLSHEETDSRLVYAGTWKSISATSASGKALVIADASGCTMTLRFYGTGASWIAKTSPAYGQATVTVDGGQPKTVDLYSKSTGWKKKVWESGSLSLGDHKVVIAWTGKKTTGATAANIDIDALVVTGVLTGTYEQDASKLKYTGTWKKTSSGVASGGSYVTADASGASVTVRFTGVRLVWIARSGADYGQAKVSVDGGQSKTVDLYATTTKSGQKVFDTGLLSMGTHTVTITCLGTKVAASTGKTIAVDAFEVTGSLK